MANKTRALAARLIAGIALLLAAGVSSASAETLLMPKRDARTTAPVVVWGVHTQAVGTVCALDFGDLSTPQDCTGVDRSYIAYPHTYAGQGTYTVTLTVGAETTTTEVQVFNPALLVGGAAGDNNRSLGINMAIQDGLRYLWTSQVSRVANFPGPPTGATTSWSNSGFQAADTSMVVLGFENQGYKIAAGVAPTGLYEKYIVRRGLNYVISDLTTLPLGITPQGDNPCVLYADCTGLVPAGGDRGYTTALAILSVAGSGALPKVNTEVAGYTNGKTYGEILQRMVNALIWGQNDANAGVGQGGWIYNFNSTQLDGSTVGWDVLALLDAAAGGATVPAWVKTEFKIGFDNALNTDGSFDYRGDGSPASNNSVGPQKNGIGLQGLFLLGENAGARVNAVTANVNSWWPGAVPFGTGGNSWGGCPTVMGVNGNHGCAYTMFNNFKGLRLMGIATLPAVNRSTHAWSFLGTTGVEDDWYADYQDWFVANQSVPTTTGGGSWGPAMGFSCCASGDAIETAIAELVLSPVTLVAPDPVLFSSVGLSPLAAVNPVRTSHTVTAFAQAANNTPIPGVTIDFKVNSGPNAGKTGTGITGGNGKTTFTYTDTAAAPGNNVDEIQAFIGTTLSSNKVIKTWGLACDVDNSGTVTLADLNLIRAKNNTVATGPTDPFDPNHDKVINVADQRYCQLRLTPTPP